MFSGDVQRRVDSARADTRASLVDADVACPDPSHVGCPDFDGIARASATTHLVRQPYTRAAAGAYPRLIPAQKFLSWSQSLPNPPRRDDPRHSPIPMMERLKLASPARGTDIQADRLVKSPARALAVNGWYQERSVLLILQIRFDHLGQASSGTVARLSI